jgi:cation diffusion facilitator family transporter
MTAGVRENALASRAMRLSLVVGVLMLIGKMTAWWLTSSAAILSDAAESVVHVIAVGFAAFSLKLSHRPANGRFPYGYERVSFFSAGFEGALIIMAAAFIIVEAIHRWRAGLFPENLGTGTAMIAAASLINLALGWYLVRTGKRVDSLILRANGTHVLTDSWTSFGVVGGLLLVIWTGWKPFDPLLAIAVAANIVWSGGSLFLNSVKGLMDYADPEIGRRITAELEAIRRELGTDYHELRFRSTGSRILVEVHLLFPFTEQLGRAHAIATEIEKRLQAAAGAPLEVVTHLEAREDHDTIHSGSGA